jgi:hypothetical protein
VPAARRAQHRAFGVEREAIARLDFDRRHALRQQGIEPGQGGRDEIVHAGAARGAHRGHDAAPGAGNVLIGGAGQARFPFIRSVAGKDQVGVCVDQAWGDPASAAIDGLRSLERRRIVRRADVDNDPVARGQHAVLDHAKSRPCHCGELCIGPDRVALHGAWSLPGLQ